MKIHRTALIAVTLLALSLPAAAQYPGQYPGGSRSLGPRQMDRVAELAQRLDDRANDMLVQYERNNRRPDRREAWVRNNLQELAQQASEFRLSVQSYRQSPRRTEAMFNDLLNTYNRVERSLSRIASRPYVDRGMVDVSDALTDLSRYYGRSVRPWNRYYDRDRDGRDDRYDRGPGRH